MSDTPTKSTGYFCPDCGSPTSVKDSRSMAGIEGIRRRRRCLSCGLRFTTWESSRTYADVEKGRLIKDVTRRIQDLAAIASLLNTVEN